jgi:hypothetical protein
MMMIIMNTVAAVEPVATYGFDARMLTVGAYLFFFIVIDLIGDWLELSFFQAVFRIRPWFTWFYLTLKSRIILAPFIIAFVFLIPHGNEPPSDILELRRIAALAIGAVGVIWGLYLGWRDTKRF